MNFDPQMAMNGIFIFTHSPLMLHSAS